MSYFFTSESVSEGHPDKVADQISDAILDAYLAQDPESKVACETLVTTGLTVISGEVKSTASVDLQKQARNVIKRIGYTKSEYKFDAESCGIISAVHEQSEDISQGVEAGQGLYEEQGAGDQGMMFGYATNETENYMPLALSLSHLLLQELAEIRRENHSVMHYLRPDAKSQVTIQYSDTNVPERIDTIVISTQHDDFDQEDKMLAKIKDILIIVNKGQLNQYKKLIPNGNNLGIKITYIEQDKPRGLPDAFVLGEKFIGKDNVAMILGDNFFYGQSLSEKLQKIVKLKKCILANEIIFNVDRGMTLTVACCCYAH